MEDRHPPETPPPPPVSGGNHVQVYRQSPRLSPAAKIAMSRMAVPVPQRPEGPTQGHAKPMMKRYLAAIVAERDPLPPTLPSGPWATRDDAKDTFDRHFFPGFSVRHHGLKVGTSKAGAKAYLLCTRAGKPTMATGHVRIRGSERTDCGWKVSLEESDEGWVISRVHCLEHNHDLAVSTAEALAHSSMRSIPEDMINLGTFLKQAGLSPAEILKYDLLTINYIAHPCLDVNYVYIMYVGWLMHCPSDI